MGILRSLADALTGMSLLVVVAGAQDQPRPREPPEVITQRGRVAPLPPEPTPPPPDPVPEITTPRTDTRPYVREREPDPPPPKVMPQCTPGRDTLMRYWQMDLKRARSLSRCMSPTCMQRTFGATYNPLMTALRKGVNPANPTEPPESYCNIIIARHCSQEGCLSGNCTSRSGFDPLSSEFRR